MAKRVVIIGAGEAGRMVVREILTTPDSGFEVVGYLDDDLTLKGQSLEAKPVLGPCENLTRLVPEMAIEEAIIAVPTGTREFVRRVVSLCRDAGIGFKIVPGMIEIIKGPVRLEQIRDVHPEDLLGRETVEFDDGRLRTGLAGRRVLVTGAGGSIGGEICRQISRFGLEELQLLGRGENQIFDIEHELRATFPELEIRAIIADIRDEAGLTRTFGQLRPHYVYHAAAHKHVHYMEAFPEEAVKNNVFGTLNVLGAANEVGVERLVMISTDKAVNPHGVMGATKRVAEFLMTDWAATHDSPRLLTVRFGNVLGSRGSVVPLFIGQIRSGGPVTVSDPEATRFFMSLREACMLVVQASMMGDGGEIFVLKMGTPLRIIEVAKDLISLHGLRPGVDVGIDIVGLRPGEKLHEDLTVHGEDVTGSEHDQILTAHPELPRDWDRGAVLARLEELVQTGDGGGIRGFLSKLIPDSKLGNG
ncbi:MAG: polysaccharide biosynthesis protein [Candidatus Latescibacterota bacterium]|nr:MAG: polysaccharide biosynthesis protein [Candidatus Latescibacterota bacterium]